MRRLLPVPEHVAGPYGDLLPDGPWVGVGMVVSLDGGVAVDGVSGGLGGAGDRAGFRGLRRLADVVLVGSGTAAAEDYAPASSRDAATRAGRGQTPAPRVAVLTASASPDPAARLFGGPAATRPLVLTTSSAPEQRRAALAEVADVVVLGDGPTVDPAAAVEALRARGMTRVVVEGGPAVLGACLRADVVDELLVTLAPTLLGDGAPRLVAAALPCPVDLALLGATVHGSELLLRYRVLGPR